MILWVLLLRVKTRRCRERLLDIYDNDDDDDDDYYYTIISWFPEVFNPD